MMGLEKIYEKGKDYLDYKMVGIGAGFTGTWTFLVNLDGPINYTITSATAQAAWTFFAGGFIMKTCEKLSTEIRNKKIAIASSIIIPSLLTIGATYEIHKNIKTENPKTSKIPALLSIPACAVWGTRKRRNLEKITLEEIQK